MPFNAALSGGQITQVRKTDQAFEHYLLVNPNDIVWQADVDENITAKNYAEFNWTNTLQGDPDNVIVGQVVLITTSTTDFSDPVFRGRVRIVPGATTFYINETGVDLTTSMYLTVIDDFDIMERLQRIDGAGTRFKDWDVLFTDLPPIIDGLQSVYADFTNAATVSWAFAPTAIAAADGASITTWFWDIGDGSFTVGDEDSQNITAQFPGAVTNEHRWVHLTVTDDNNSSTTFHFEVYTVNKQSSTAVKLDTGETQITSSIADGWNATVTAWSGFGESAVIDQTRVAIAGIDNYDGTATPIVSNIMMVGRLRVESNTTIADELAAEFPEVILNIEGFATQLARIPAPAVSIIDDATPTKWGDITDPNPFRAIVYLLAYHTTFASLSSISTDTLTTYVLGDFSLGETTVLDNITKQLESVNGIAAFAPSGETTLRRQASYQSTADRAGLTTVFDFTTADMTSLAMDFEYGETVGEIEAGAVVYNTTLDDIDFRYIGRAPASSFGTGHETAQLNGQVLVADQSDTNARSELVQRAADHLRYINPKIGLTVSLMDGFWWIIPTLHQRWTHTLAATDTARGRVYTSSDYWQLVSTIYTADNESNIRELSATFEEETQGENAGISVTLAPDPNLLEYSLPPLSPYDTFPDDILTNFPVDDPDFDPYFGGGMAAVMEPSPNNQDNPLNSEVLNIPMWFEQSRATTRNTTPGETYTIRVEGMAEIIQAVTWEKTWDFTIDSQGWVNLPASTPGITPGSAPRGTYTPGVGWTTSNNGVRIRIDSAVTGQCNELNIFYDTAGGPGGSKAFVRGWGRIGEGAIPDVADPSTTAGGSFTEGTGQSILLASLVRTTDRVFMYVSFSGMTITVTKAVARGTGENPFGGGENDGATFGDAFYRWKEGEAATLHGALLGLLINGAVPGTIGPYTDSHDYTFTATGTGAPLSFKFKLSDYTDVTRNIIKVTVTGPNMGTTP